MMAIGERIKVERQKKGISQAALGDMLQVTQQAVAKWEKNLSEPDSQLLIKLSEVFGVSVDYLLGREDITPEERAAGVTATKKESITPIEDELLYLFREVGAKRGEAAQRALIELMEKMI